MSQVTMEKIVNMSKTQGFVYQGSEIYGGLANTWDYGPLGVELKNNVKKAWWKKFIQESPYNVGLDSAILMNPQTWVASGHVGGFSDPLMDCKVCKSRHRADKLIEDHGDDIVADGDLLIGALHLAGGQGENVAGVQLHFPLLKGAKTQFRPLGVQHDSNRAVQFCPQLFHGVHPALMLLVRAVGKVETGHVHSCQNHLAQDLFFF